ncbi:hypothetical protein R3P38DRAFT_3532291, partial [Favolaschia claudopus]
SPAPPPAACPAGGAGRESVSSLSFGFSRGRCRFLDRMVEVLDGPQERAGYTCGVCKGEGGWKGGGEVSVGAGRRRAHPHPRRQRWYPWLLQAPFARWIGIGIDISTFISSSHAARSLFFRAPNPYSTYPSPAAPSFLNTYRLISSAFARSHLTSSFLSSLLSFRFLLLTEHVSFFFSRNTHSPPLLAHRIPTLPSSQCLLSSDTSSSCALECLPTLLASLPHPRLHPPASPFGSFKREHG